MGTTGRREVDCANGVRAKAAVVRMRVRAFPVLHVRNSGAGIPFRPLAGDLLSVEEEGSIPSDLLVLGIVGGGDR
jgi:hypothetical protein